MRNFHYHSFIPVESVLLVFQRATYSARGVNGKDLVDDSLSLQPKEYFDGTSAGILSQNDLFVDSAKFEVLLTW